jgi:hypothetical protein
LDIQKEPSHNTHDEQYQRHANNGVDKIGFAPF